MLRDFLRAALTIAGKDLRAELRSRELLGLMALFALLAVLVFSFALELDRPGRQDAVSGVLWVTLLFASILGHNRSVALEREQGGFDACCWRRSLAARSSPASCWPIPSSP